MTDTATCRLIGEHQVSSRHPESECPVTPARDEYFVAVVPASGKAIPYFTGPWDAERAASEAAITNGNGEGDHAVVIGRRA